MLVRLTSESGANAVEFALLLPVLIVLIFGILYGGIVLNGQLSVTQAAREGARFGATLPIPVGGGGEPDAGWYTQVRVRANAASAGTLGGSDVICVWFVTAGNVPLSIGNDAACGSPPSELVSGDPEDRVVVLAERPAEIDFILYSIPTMLTGRAVARHEGGLPS